MIHRGIVLNWWKWLGFVLLAIAVVLSLLLVLTTQKPEIFVAMLTATLTGLGFLVNRNVENERMYLQKHFEQRIEAYSSLITTLVPASANNTKTKLIIWASPETIRSYRAISKLRIENPKVREDIGVDNIALENFLFSLRSDLGLSNVGLEQGDLLRFVIVEKAGYYD